MESTKFYKVSTPEGSLLKLLKTTNDLATVEKNNINNLVVEISEKDFFTANYSIRLKRADQTNSTIGIDADIRVKRNHLLQQTDWTQLLDVPEATRLKWQEYRQALRDVPDQPGFPDNIVWPQPPQ